MKPGSQNKTVLTMENIYKLGEVVCERVRPNQKLIITRQNGKVYHCVPQENRKRKPLVFLARDLRGNAS